ncbi:unnamed protein product [Musa hybrid cultivar]
MKRMLMEIQEVTRVKLNLSRIYQIGFISSHLKKKRVDSVHKAPTNARELLPFTWLQSFYR